MTEGPDNGSGLAADSGERYERGERIATGGMGEVWRARDTVLGREVAVKVLKNEYADDPTFRARFEAEARHAAGLHHPGIASVFDYGLLKGTNTPYLVMELVDGKPLSDLLAEGRPFDPEQARVLALQTAEALAVAHAAGVIHRDVKPGNLLVTPDGRVKITDFGIARALGSVAFTQTGQIVGTPHYLSPEQAHGQSATAASDVYALGVVLYECLSGRRPFSADTPIATALAHIQQDVPTLPDTVPPALAAVVTRALAKDPAARYADGGDFAEALRGAAPGATPLAAPVPADTGDHTQVLGAAAAPVAAAGLAGGAHTPASTPVPTSAPTSARARSRWPLYAGIALVLLLLAALLVTRPWSQDPAGSEGDGTSDTVRVRKAAYVGEPVGEVRAALRKKGLKTRVESATNPGEEQADTVADLSPTGTVEKGATITLQVWGEPPASEPTTDPTESTDPEKPQKTDKPDKPGKPEKTDQPAKPEKTEVAPTDTTTATAGADTGPGTGTGTGTGSGRTTDNTPGPGSGSSSTKGG
jgi:serine/threonine-protein kinase